MTDPLKMSMSEAFDQFVHMTFDDKLSSAERDSMQQIFFSGALHALSSVSANLNEGHKPTDPVIQRLAVLYAELK